MEKTIQQVSGNNSKEKSILSIIVKRTYTILDNGKCILSDKQLPLVSEIEVNDENTEIINSDIDIYPYKLLTDIVLKGKAKSLNTTNNFIASIEVEKTKHYLSIFGNRKVYKAQNGEFKFSEATIIDEIPLEYQYSYGGKDLLAEKPIREFYANNEMFKFTDIETLFVSSPYRYQRNPAGKGFIVEPNTESLNLLELPNIENPYQYLTSENFICTNVEEWYKMPVPVNTNWVDPGWFPRVAYFGVFKLPKGIDENIFEIKNNWGNEDLLKSSYNTNNATFSFRALNGASLGLQTKHLQGGESIRLTNIHPKHSDFTFQLPKERPQIKVDGRNGKLLKTDPVIHTVIIEPNEHRLSIVWRGSAKAIRGYFDEELKTMPFEVKW